MRGRPASLHALVHPAIRRDADDAEANCTHATAAQIQRVRVREGAARLARVARRARVCGRDPRGSLHDDVRAVPNLTLARHAVHPATVDDLNVTRNPSCRCRERKQRKTRRLQTHPPRCGRRQGIQYVGAPTRIA